MVPNGWSIKILEDLASVERGKFSARPRNDPKYYGGEIPFVQTGDIASANTYLSSFSQTLNEEGLKVSRLFPNNSILITIAANIGDTAITSFEVACPDSLVGIQPKQDVDCFWLNSFLETCKDELDGKATQNAQKNINLQVLKPLEILTPPYEEQRKIAKILSIWDKAIASTGKLIETSKQQKKALMQQLLTGKKRLVNPETGNVFEGDWVQEEIDNLLREVKRPVEWDDDADYHLLSVKRRSEGVVLREVLNGHKILTKKMNLAKEGDFLISKMQVVHGASGLVTSEFDNCHISGSYISLVPKNSDSLDIEFFSWLSKQKKMYHQAFLCSYGVHIEKMTFNFKLYLKEKISLPSNVSEQQKIASVLTAADRDIEVLEAKLSHLKQEKKALMQQLLTGKRRVQVEESVAA
ncbi:restriction endonuclease subunit S [Vibrio splendidus]|uniref:restriction endonuclease subunit S n=1 Tax=Vibrio splendidus TaxID=29497 RepID=UPI000C85379C|nr:restriction endonuclease subunit S [Vibrio splendidus]PMH05550.1 type I site-specific deoxyribonuclease [Vibrio splendidus]